jgi:ATP-binding cassette subfamily F protein uup
MDKLVDHLFILDSSTTITDFPGNYTDYRIQEESQTTSKQKVAKPAAQVKIEKPKQDHKKLSYNEQKEFKTLGNEISKLESRRDKLSEKLNSGSSTDHAELADWSSEIKRINSTLDENEMKWLELSERA